MRALLILCEPRHAAQARDHLRKFAHPQTIGVTAEVLEVSLDLEKGDEQRKVSNWFYDHRKFAPSGCLIAAPKEIAMRLSLEGLSAPMGFELQITSADALARPSNKSDPYLKTLVRRCELDLVTASATFAQSWTNATVDRPHIEHWLDQFARLDRHAWLGRLLLGQMTMPSGSGLSQALATMPIAEGTAMCVNRDPRGNFKSADILGTLLTKQFAGRVVHDSPARAIEHGTSRSVVLIEDGLWSGTEAMGIIDSLLGHRPDPKLKTPKLEDPRLLQDTQLTLAYAVGTDYGQAMIRRHLRDRGLEHVQVQCSTLLSVATPQLLEQMQDPAFQLQTIRETGPERALLKPHAFEVMRSQGMSETDIARAVRFTAEIGRQLFSNYLRSQQEKHGWTPWEGEKLLRAANGMHGLGLTFGFSHSIPKACLPLFWASGRVELSGSVVDWRPLFPNS